MSRRAGSDLRQLCDHLERAGKRLGDEAIWYIGHRVAGALAHAHAVTDDEGNPAPAVHLSLRPDDVLIAWDGRVRLVARGRSAADLLGAGVGPGRESGVAEEYMAPEQRRGERVTHRADVYRLGVLLWSLLAWRRPPSDGSRPESLGLLRSDVPREIAEAIDTALEPSAARRRLTCLELEQWFATKVNAREGERELRELVAALHAPAPAEAPALPPAPPPPAALSPAPAPAPPPPAAPAPAPASAPPPPIVRAPPSEVRPAPLGVRLAPSGVISQPVPRESQPLSPLGFIAVALVTAAIIVVAGIAIGDRVLGAAPGPSSDLVGA